MEAQLNALAQEISVMKQELMTVTSMNVPMLMRTVDARVQHLESFAAGIGNVDQSMSDKIKLIEERLKDQFQGGWKNKPILECKSI